PADPRAGAPARSRPRRARRRCPTGRPSGMSCGDTRRARGSDLARRGTHPPRSSARSTTRSTPPWPMPGSSPGSIISEARRFPVRPPTSPGSLPGKPRHGPGWSSSRASSGIRSEWAEQSISGRGQPQTWLVDRADSSLVNRYHLAAVAEVFPDIVAQRARNLSAGTSSVTRQWEATVSRQATRYLCSVIILAFGGYLIWLGDDWRSRTTGGYDVGYLIVAIGVAGLLGLNI